MSSEKGNTPLVYADDAEVVGTALDLTQTTRAVDHNTRVPMVGFPQHRLETYLTMLTDRGYDVEVNSLEDGERSTRTVVSTTKEAPVESKPIGRIDYLGTDGKVGESIEYTSPYQFEKDIKEENYYGVPMSIVLYKDKDGNTIPHGFIAQLDPPPKGFEIIDSPYLPENALDKAKHLIDDFCREEYQREDGADYTDLTDVGVAYTTTEDDKHEIQARVNLVDSDSELGMRLVAYLPELHCAVDIAGATVTEKREQSVKAHICQSNRLGYYLIKRTADASQMAAEIKTLFIRNHIYLHTDSEKDVQVLRERFLEWKNRNACKLNGKY